MNWLRWLLLSECKTCSELLLENEKLTKERDHFKNLALTLAEKITHRPTGAAPITEAPSETPAPKPRHKPGRTWPQARAELEEKAAT